ncbi:MAG: CHAT domain-containing protein [bacterium]
MDWLFRHKEVYPPLYETAAYVYVYEKRFDAGHAFFDSLLAAGHHKGNIAGAHAILWQTQQMPDSSLKYARMAVVENSRCVYPYEVFVDKSFELKNSKAAFESLQQQHQRHPENWRLIFAMALCHLKQSNYTAACDTLRSLLADSIKNWRIYYVLGRTIGPLESWGEAKRVHQTGISYCEVAHDEEGLARMLHGRAQAELALGELQARTVTLQQGLELAHRIGNRLLEGGLLLLLGQTQLQRHQWLETERTFATVVKQAREYFDGELLLHAYDYLSELALERGKRSEALAYANKAFDVADSLGMRSNAASFLFDLTLIEFDAGRCPQALELAQKTLDYVQSQNLGSYISYGYQNLASILNALGRYSEALNHCKKARSLAQKNYTFEQLIRLDFLRGEILLHLGQVSPAYALLSQTAVKAKAANRMTPFMYAQIWLAQIEKNAHQYGRAKQRLTQALSSLPEAPGYEANLKILSLLADIAWQTGERAQALKIYDDAARTIIGQTHRSGPDHLSSLSSIERNIFFCLSRAYVETGQIERALAETERARDLIVKRKRWQAEQLRHEQADSAKFRQLAVLDSLLQNARLEKATTDSAQLQLRLTAKIANWESQLMTLQGSVVGMNAAHWLDTAPFPIRDFRLSLRARNELALSFFIGDSSTLVFFLAADTLAAKSVPIGRQSLEQQLLHIHRSLNTLNADALNQGTAQFDTAAAARVYGLLVHDFLAHRPESSLAIVPDGVLHALPFEILTLASERQGNAPFLIERFAVRYGSTLADFQQDDLNYLAIRSFLLAAAPTLPPAQASAPISLRGATPWLSEVGKLEAEAIRDLVRCQTILTGDGLTRAAFLSALRKSDWLHLASHGFAQPGEPLLSEIILSIPPKKNQPERFFAFEIFQMTLPLKMAILSGCETVRGTFIESEGFEGFVQAFRAAGAPSVIASLWKVDDDATAQFFKAYYEALCAGHSTVRALQTAKLQMLKRSNYNFTDWAAFAYYGRDWRVEFPRQWSLKDWMLLGGILVLLCFLGWRLALRGRKAN